MADSSVSDQEPSDTTVDSIDDGLGDGVATADADDGDATSDVADDADTCPPGGCTPCVPACGAGRVCNNGTCECGAGLTDCGTCVDLDRDPANCHGCGLAGHAEECNGADDDCNGETDEGLIAPVTPCEHSNAVGTCVGTWSCGANGWTCPAAIPEAELCDGIDNDCNSSTDEGFRDLSTGAYESDHACGSCSNDCTAGLGPDQHAHGTCDLTAAPTCHIICCTAGDLHPNCDGSDWENTNGQAGDGCEDRVVRACNGEGDCPQAEVCTNHECVPNQVGGSCVGDGDCSLGDVCVGGICGCTGDVYTADVVPPNVLIVLDRSGSMTDPIEAGGPSKWTIAKTAVKEITEAYEGQVRFGLKLFPGIDQAGTKGADCGPGVVWLDPAPENAEEINTFLANSGTSSGTPIAEALRALLDYPGLEDPTRNNYVVLITDGMANCDDPVPEVTNLFEQNPQIKTFVIGFGGEVDPTQLSNMASAGGTAQGADGYYQADDPLGLGNALSDVVGNVLGCDYVLNAVPPDAASLGVYFDKVQQPLDPTHTEGWDYTPQGNRVTFYGTACDSLLAGTVADLVFVYGCPNPIIIGGH